jgi:hypothetical protein
MLFAKVVLAALKKIHPIRNVFRTATARLALASRPPVNPMSVTVAYVTYLHRARCLESLVAQAFARTVNLAATKVVAIVVKYVHRNFARQKKKRLRTSLESLVGQAFAPTVNLAATKVVAIVVQCVQKNFA